MKTTFTLHALDCHSCAMMIEGICEDERGVTKAEVNVVRRQLTVEHDDQVTPGRLQAILNDGGYPVEIAT